MISQISNFYNTLKTSESNHYIKIPLLTYLTAESDNFQISGVFYPEKKFIIDTYSTATEGKEHRYFEEIVANISQIDISEDSKTSIRKISMENLNIIPKDSDDINMTSLIANDIEGMKIRENLLIAAEGENREEYTHLYFKDDNVSFKLNASSYSDTNNSSISFENIENEPQIKPETTDPIIEVKKIFDIENTKIEGNFDKTSGVIYYSEGDNILDLKGNDNLLFYKNQNIKFFLDLEDIEYKLFCKSGFCSEGLVHPNGEIINILKFADSNGWNDIKYIETNDFENVGFKLDVENRVIYVIVNELIEIEN